MGFVDKAKNLVFGSGDPGKTAEKFAGYGILLILLQFLMSFLASSSEPALDITVRGFLMGLVLAAVNALKHRGD